MIADNVDVSPAKTNSAAKPWRQLEVSAWIALALHALAGLALLALLRDGLDTNPDPAARLRYVQDHSAAWMFGWLSWHAASISIVVFFLMLYRAADAVRESASGPIAVVLVIIAAAMDLAGQSLLIAFAPSDQDAASIEAWFTIQRIAVILSGYAANSLYSAATLLATLLLWPWASRFASALGLLVFMTGMALSVAAFAGSAEGMFWTNAVLVPAILGWLGGIALLSRRLARAGC